MKILITLAFLPLLVMGQNNYFKNLRETFDKEMVIKEEGDTIIFETLYSLDILDFEKFQNDIRDSIAIQTIYFSTEEDEEALSYLNYNKRLNIDPSEREYNRTLFSLNKTVKNLYGDYTKIFLQFMLIPRQLRPLINNSFLFDDRFLYYEVDTSKLFKYTDTSISTTAYSIYHNHWQLSKFSNYSGDIPDVLAQTLPISFNEIPPYGLSKNQYKAYLDWKAKNIYSVLKSKKIDCQYEITPIFQENTFDFTVDGNALYKQWIIEETEYDEFIKYSKDSITRETLFFELAEWQNANKFIHYEDYYLSEQDLEYVEFDPSEKDINRKLFFLNYKSKIKLNKPEVETIVKKLALQQKDSLSFCYSTLDLQNSPNNKAHFKLDLLDKQPWLKIDTIRVNILPIKNSEKNVNFIQLLNYNQAIAFYNWKYPISKSKKGSNWQNYIFPTKVEFAQMQSNSPYNLADKSFSYITTTLKYQIKFFSM